LTVPRGAGNLLIIVNENVTDTPASRTHGPDLILHPIRMRLIVALGAGVPMAAAQLLERMPDVPPATLYRHLTVLRQGGIITFADEPGPREAGERRTRGAVERRYVLRAGAASLAPEDIASATPDDHLRWFASFLASLLGSFSRYVGAGVPDFARDGVGYREVVLQLSDDELIQMSIALNTALMPFVANTPGNGRTARLFATVFLPADPVPAGHINGSVA
jgi:DNA-binding transcriptional ArsR family regulator